MKALIIMSLLFSVTLLCGCNTTPTYAVKPKMVENCCNDENYQSGYYYNGYKENGWRYCVGKKVEFQ